MNAIRVPISVLAGAALSVALFLGLWRLVSVPFTVAPMAEAKRIEFTRQIPETTAEDKRKEKIVREAPTLEPKPSKLTIDREPGGIVAQFTGERITPVLERRGIGTRGIDGDVTPLVRMEPDYPPGAASRGTEGWVQVRFAVTAVGTVRDAVVVASEPGTTFDDAALKAVARWRYNPRVVDGVAVERIGLETVFRFELE